MVYETTTLEHRLAIGVGHLPLTAAQFPLHPFRVMPGAWQHSQARNVTDQLGMSIWVALYVPNRRISDRARDA